MAQCEREPGFMAETEKLLEGHLGAGKGVGVGGGRKLLEWGLWRNCWWVRDPAMERESQSPCHIPLKSKCRGTSPGRSSNVAQRLGRQAVTALGHSPTCLAWPLPTPSGPGLRESGSRPPVDRPEPYTTYWFPSQSLCWVRNSSNIHQGERSRRDVCVWGGELHCLTAPPAPRPLDGGPAESAADDNPHLTTRPFCLQGLCRSTHPHGNSGRAIHTIWVGNKPSAANLGWGRGILGECSLLNLFTFILSLGNHVFGSSDLISETLTAFDILTVVSSTSGDHTVLFEVLHCCFMLLKVFRFSLSSMFLILSFLTASAGI